MLSSPLSSTERSMRRFLVATDNAMPVALAARTFADAAASFLETSAAPLEDGERSVTVEDVSTGERQAFTLDVA